MRVEGTRRTRHAKPAPARAPRPARPAGKPQRPSSARGLASAATLLAIPVFLLIALLAVALGRLHPWMAVGYLVMSGVSFAAYAVDKSAARRGAWRIAENTLHALALFGGWPGALLAQQWLRHKSSKARFRGVFWLTVVANVAAFVWLCAPGRSAG